MSATVPHDSAHWDELQRLVAHGDAVPARLADHANRQWSRPTVQEWVRQKRPPLVGY